MTQKELIKLQYLTKHLEKLLEQRDQRIQELEGLIIKQEENET